MINDFFTHPMRIFFLSAVFCVVLGCAGFYFASDFIGFHKFAFLGLVCPVAYAGFLFTAVPDWANFKGGLKPHAVAMFLLFIAALASLSFELKFSYFFMSCFWLYLTIFCLALLVLDKNKDNFSVLSVLIAFCAFSFLYVFTGDELFLNAQIHLNMIAIVVVSFRVSIVVAREALKLEAGMDDAFFAPNPVYKNLAVTSFCALITAQILGASAEILGFISLACGFISLARLSEWHHASLIRHHFIIFYYLISLIAGAGYVWLGASELLNLAQDSNALHLIAIGAAMGVIMFIFNVAGLRHSGQELEFLRLSRWAMGLVFGAAIARSALMTFNDIFYIVVPSLLLSISFVFWAINFYPIFRDNEFSDDPQ